MKFYSSKPVPFEAALAAYKAAHARYLAGPLHHGVTRMADARAFEDLQDALRREDRPWCAEDYR